MTLTTLDALVPSLATAQSRLETAQDALLAIKCEHDWRLELERQMHLRKEQVIADEFTPRLQEAAALVADAERALRKAEQFAGLKLAETGG